jgi:hypothetical protein
MSENAVLVVLLTDLIDAVRRHDRDAAAAVIDRIDAVAGRTVTDRILDAVIAAALRRLANPSPSTH